MWIHWFLFYHWTNINIFHPHSGFFSHLITCKSLDWQNIILFLVTHLSLSLVSLRGPGRLTLIYSPFSISFADFGTRFLFVSLWGTKRGQSLSASFAWDSDWNEILFPVLMFGIWCKSVCLSSVLKQTINQQLEASGLQLQPDRDGLLRGSGLKPVILYCYSQEKRSNVGFYCLNVSWRAGERWIVVRVE